MLEPEQVALLVRDDDRPFALIGRWAGGGALIGSEPVRVAEPDHDPFQLLDAQPLVAPGRDSGRARAVGGGWFGYLGYRLAGQVEAVGASPPRIRRLPDFELAFYDHLLRLDAERRWWFEALWTEARGPAISRRLVELGRRAARGTPRPRRFSTTPWTAVPASGGHAVAVEAARERIHAGDIFQANLTRRISARLTGEPVDLFAVAAPRLRPDRAAWFSGPWGALASLSPELFLERHGRRVRSAPIKGTCPQPSDPDAARASAAGLRASAKDRAENVMIVDLVRNDLGRVCEPGSIRVAALAEPRAHAGVWHLVSEVVGRAAAGVGDRELVRAAFPPGSVTGAPKVAALEVIAELESSAREVYTGAIGFASPLAGLELSVAIRTFEFSGDDVWVGVGGAVVADSVPADELRECATKLAPLLAAIDADLASAGSPTERWRAPRPLRLAARPVPRPDPRAGVFETMLVRRGRTVALERHLARLSRSVEALYGRRLPADTVERVAAAATEIAPAIGATAGQPGGRARLRLTARPSAGGIELAIVTAPLAGERPPLALRTTTITGGLGAHKWVDRRWIDALEQRLAPERPVFCDADGRLLEASRANVFVVDPDGVLVTPPDDGRLLPGVARARTLRIAGRLGLESRVEEIDRERWSRASEVFVTGSLAGVEPVEWWDSRRLGPAGPVTLLLARALAAGQLRPERTPPGRPRREAPRP